MLLLKQHSLIKKYFSYLTNRFVNGINWVLSSMYNDSKPLAIHQRPETNNKTTTATQKTQKSKQARTCRKQARGERSQGVKRNDTRVKTTQMLINPDKRKKIIRKFTTQAFNGNRFHCMKDLDWRRSACLKRKHYYLMSHLWLLSISSSIIFIAIFRGALTLVGRFFLVSPETLFSASGCFIKQTKLLENSTSGKSSELEKGAKRGRTGKCLLFSVYWLLLNIASIDVKESNTAELHDFKEIF